jgi:iron complex transport system substrate-binding protein
MPNRLILVVASLALVIAACGSSEDASGEAPASDPSTTTVIDGPTYEGVDGVTSSIADTSRIVSMNGDLTEIIYELGAGDRVVGIDLTTTYPPEATALPDVGLGRDLNVEAIIGLSPTIVIGDTQVEPESAIEQLRTAGIPVVILQTEVTLEGVPRKIENMGEILGLEAEAEALAERVQGEIDKALALAERATTSPRAAYMYVRGPETLLLFGNGMPTHFLIEAANGVDAAGDVGVFFAQNLQAEKLVEAAPDVLITPIQGFEILGGLDAFLALPGVADTPAGRSGTVLTYDEALFLGMGPRVGEALRQLVLDLHPEIDG